MSTVIKIENVWKQYKLGVISHGNIVNDVQSWWARFWGKEDPNVPIIDHGLSGENREKDTIWALRDVSLEVQEGETFGIIGGNGAGKSTLLKIISRITAPTRGQVKIKGRITSLLEVGTGFHPELTGRENVFLNGAILGMGHAEIKRKFDEIVDFSGIERFIDTPVKRYSSGMYVRLAFAVAAHLDSEILILDEVLAVGDAEFQKKCIRKMEGVTLEGRTVVFVSHSLQSVAKLCERSLCLENGHIRWEGPSETVIEAYMPKAEIVESVQDVAALIRSLPTDPACRIESIRISQAGKATNRVFNGQAVEIEVQYSVLRPSLGFRVYVDLLGEDGSVLVRTFHDEDRDSMETTYPGRYIAHCIIPPNILAPHNYEILIQATIYNVRNCTGRGVRILLTVESSNGINRAYPSEPIRSKMQPLVKWQTTAVY